GYLGGLALSGPLGLWESGLGAGLAVANSVLVGTRDVDPAEQNLVDEGFIELVTVGPDMAENLRRAIAGRPVYVHIDCDVLDPGVVPTDYIVPDGMTLDQLSSCAQVLASSELIGIEIGELETNVDDDYDGTCPPAQIIIAALEPLFEKITQEQPGVNAVERPAPRRRSLRGAPTRVIVDNGDRVAVPMGYDTHRLRDSG
ncbi:MAG: arginase family protein, partial [Lacisediminihabitans sp.]